MSRRTRNTTKTNGSDSDNDKEQSDESKELLTTILMEIREIKKQNTSLREETKKEIAKLREEIKIRDEKWQDDKNMIHEKMEQVEKKVENTIDKIGKRLNNLEEAEERRKQQEKRNNIIIKTAGNEKAVQTNGRAEVEDILRSIEVDANFDQVRYMGKDWKGRNMLLVKMTNMEEKLKVMKNKKKLSGKECYIENDMTKEERQIQASIRRRAREEISKGNTARVGYKKIQINGKWEYFNKQETKNEQPHDIAKPAEWRRRTM